MTIATILSLGETALKLGLICSLTVLALFLSYSMLNVCDLSTDGCFTLGAAVGAAVAVSGHPFLSIFAAMAAGVCSGFVTAILQTKLGVDSLLAGIIVNTGLYSVNIAVMGGSSLINMNRTETVFSMMKETLKNTPLKGRGDIVVAFIAVAIVIAFLVFFLRTRLGLAIRATGNNADMVKSSSINPVFTTIVGLCVANSFTALSGCLLSQSQKSVDINIGQGMVTIALASLLIGGTILGRGGIFVRAVGMVLGSFIFRLVYTVALRFNMPAFMLKLVSSVIVVLAISGPYLKKQWPQIKRRMTHRKGVHCFMLKIEHISKTFNPGTVNEKQAIKDLSLNLEKGDFATIIGSNGAGKSTLFNAICGDFLTDSGVIMLDGQDITFMPQHVRAKTIGRLYQDPMRGTAPGMTIEENLALAAGKGGWLSHVSRQEKEHFYEELKLLDIGLEKRMSHPVGLLSGGQRQALTLLMATMNPPKLLLLDEHTAALDPGTAEKVLNLTKRIVEEHQLTCLMITHNMQSALDLGNRILMMDSGNIVLDIHEEEKKGLTVEGLLDKFKTGAGKMLDNDRILLSGEKK